MSLPQSIFASAAKIETSRVFIEMQQTTTEMPTDTRWESVTYVSSERFRDFVKCTKDLETARWTCVTGCYKDWTEVDDKSQYKIVRTEPRVSKVK